MDEAKPVECPLESVMIAITFCPHDFGAHHRLAWIYGIAVGWDEASYKELTEKFQWTTDTVERLKRLRAKWESIEASEKSMVKK